MNQTILFTPVGGTDPISLNNYHDGSILHICRFYKPDKVILYMSKEMLDFRRKMTGIVIVWTVWQRCRIVP